LSYRGIDHRIELAIDVPKKQLFHLDIAIPLGLFVNEIITNSLKYGVKNTSDPIISISIHQGGIKKYVLSISDNGSGFDPEKINKDTLGLMLIESLANQLDGKLSLSSGPEGTAYALEF
jgi:two-component sensor histidine kinase